MSPVKLIERNIFRKDTQMLDRIEANFDASLRKNRKEMTFLIVGLIAVMLSMLFMVVFFLAASGKVKLAGFVLATFLSVGLGIQVGTMSHSKISQKVNREIEAINKLISESNKTLSQMDFIITDVLKKTEAKANEEILNEIKIKNINPEITTKELLEIMGILANRQEIKQPGEKYTIFIVDIPEREIRDYIGEEHIAQVTRLGHSNLGYKTLLYIHHEFSEEKIKDIKKKNPTLRAIDMSSFLQAGTKLTQEMNKLGISFKDISEETKVWVSELTGHERRELIAKIKRLKNDMMELAKKLKGQEERFQNIKVILDTTLAVLLLAVAGIIGFFIDMLY